MPPKQQENFSRGGFGGLPNTARELAAQRALANATRERGQEQRRAREGPVSRDEEDVIRLANVPFAGWEKEKERRCEVAFNRIIEKDWYDKYEGNMSEAEMIHVNAVREHFALRRDKVKTPAMVPHKRTNTIGCLQWAAEMEAIEELNRDTGVQNGFRDLMLKKATAKAKQRGHGMGAGFFAK